MSSDIERKMDEFGANILVTPKNNGLAINDVGQTVVMVTHNPENGVYSDRTINMKDSMVMGGHA